MVIFRKLGFYLAIGGIVLLVFLVQKLQEPGPKPKILMEPTINPYENTLASSGIIEAMDRNVAIGSPQSGLVTELYVKVGEKVQKNQPLFELDGRELIAQLKVQEANINVAKAQLRHLEIQLERLQSVQDKRAVSQREITNLENDVLVANAQLALAESQADQSQSLIDRLTIRASKDSTILQVNIREGEFVTASANTPAILLGVLDRLQIRADLDEQNAVYFSSDMPATAFPKNQPSFSIPLQFERIEPYIVPKRSLTGLGDEKVDTRVLQILYSFERPEDFPLYVGQQMDVFIQRKKGSLEPYAKITVGDNFEKLPNEKDF